MKSMVVVGGGPAGAALAIHLATAGREVLLLEKARAPVDKVCGEFLSPESQASLAAMHLRDEVRATGAEDLIDWGCHWWLVLSWLVGKG